MAANLSDAVDDIKTWLDDGPIDPDIVQQISDSVDDSAPNLASGLAGNVFSVLNSATGVVSGLVFALIVLYYLLKKGRPRPLRHPIPPTKAPRCGTGSPATPSVTCAGTSGANRVRR